VLEALAHLILTLYHAYFSRWDNSCVSSISVSSWTRSQVDKSSQFQAFVTTLQLSYRLFCFTHVKTQSVDEAYLKNLKTLKNNMQKKYVKWDTIWP